MSLAIEPEVRALSVTWLRQVEQIAEEMYTHLVRHISVIESYPELGGLTKASCCSNIETILSMLQNDIPSSAAEAPVTALEHARAMAKRGAEVDDTLRFYRLGHGYFMQRWTEDLSAVVTDRRRLLLGVQQTAAFMVEYIDIVCTRVSAEHLAERERRQRRATVMRADLVRALLSGESVDVAATERVLGHRLGRPQLAFVCWSDHDAPELERAATAVAEVLGAQRPLLVAEGPRLIGGWVSPLPDETIDRGRLDDTIRTISGHVSVAFGTVRPGLDGFRLSRREADRARRLAELDGRRDRTVHFADIAMLDLLTSDLPAARAFVQSELGALAHQDPGTDAIRRTVLSVLAPRGGGAAAAARELGLHRNTVLQRIHRAETLRGAPITERAPELYLALTLACQLGSQIL